MKKFCLHLIIFLIFLNSFTGCALALGIFGETEKDETTNTSTIDEKPELSQLTAGKPASIKDLMVTDSEITISWIPARDPEVPEQKINYRVFYTPETEAPEISGPEDLLKPENDGFFQIKGMPSLTEIDSLTSNTSYLIHVLADNTKEDYVLYDPAIIKTRENQDYFEFEDSETTTNLISDAVDTETTIALAPPGAPPALYRNFTISADVRFTTPLTEESWVGLVARASKTSDNQYKGYLFRFSPVSMGIGVYRNNDNGFHPLSELKPAFQKSDASHYSIKVRIHENSLTFAVKTVDGADGIEITGLLDITDSSFSDAGHLVLYSKNASATISKVIINSSDITTQ